MCLSDILCIFRRKKGASGKKEIAHEELQFWIVLCEIIDYLVNRLSIDAINWTTNTGYTSVTQPLEFRRHRQLTERADAVTTWSTCITSGYPTRERSYNSWETWLLSREGTDRSWDAPVEFRPPVILGPAEDVLPTPGILLPYLATVSIYAI